jgi:hypothetical protein
MEYKIKVGSVIKIKKGFWQGSFQIMYCGMSNKETFVLSPYVTEGYQGFSPNIYYNIKSLHINILDIKFYILEVTPEYIVMEN